MIRRRSASGPSLAVRLTVLSTTAFALAATTLLVAECFLLQYVVEVSVDATTGSSSQGEAPDRLDASTAVFRVAHDLANTVMLFSTITAAVMVGLAGLAVWLVAHRSLGRVAEVTALAQQITGENLDRQLNLAGPRDEIRDLGDTIDDMLSRLHLAFDQQERFVANASHELRTPLAGIRATLEASLLHDDIEEPTRTSITRALTSTERTERILAALLQLARSRRLTSLQSHAVDLRHTAEVALDAVRNDAEQAGHTFVVDLGDAQADGDEVLMMQAIYNLLENAVIHGSAEVPIRVHTAIDGDRAVFTVASGGTVIDPAEASKLVEPFNRGDQTRLAVRGAGTGLGLSIAESIATQHAGSLEVVAQDVGGLRVELRLPAAEE